MTKSKFIVVKHDAKKARLHYDLRFVMPNSKNWMSFAVRKGVPEKPGAKVLAVRTHDHSDQEALFLGTIPDGEYGAGKLTKYDDGRCDIIKFSPGHIVINFKGKKIKGLYHMINTGKFNKRDYKKQQYLLFKSATTTIEGTGMIERIPTCGEKAEVEEDDYERNTSPLSWSRKNIDDKILELSGWGGAKFRKKDIEDEEKSEEGGEKLKWSNNKSRRVVAAEQIYDMLKKLIGD